MEYMGNRDYWDKKFTERGSNLLPPEKTLVQNIGCFEKGSMLDLACGDGRNTMFLLENGFEVTAVDFSEKALERLKNFAHKNRFIVKTEQIDLSKADALEHLGLFDNVVINHYRLNKAQIAELKNHLSAGGILFVCGFGHKNSPNGNIKQEDLIQPNDFEEIGNCFEQIQFLEEQDERGYFVTYLFRKIG